MALFHHTAKGSVPDEQFSWSLWTEADVALSVAQLAWEGAVSAFWTGQLDGVMSQFTSIDEVTTASIDLSTGKQISRLATGTALPGTAIQGPLPPQVALCVSLRTATATRSGRGRFYLAGFDKSLVSQDGRVTPAEQTAIVTAANQFFQSLLTDAMTPVIAHRTVPMTTTPLTSFDVGDVFDTQRRRRKDLREVRQTGSI